MTEVDRPLAIATCRAWPDLLDDDRPFVRRLEQRGIPVRTFVWDEPHDLGDVRAVLIRSVWDYFQKAAAFRRWLDRLEAERVPCLNPVALLRWNMDKGYLRELAGRGVPQPPTVFFERHEGDARAALARVAATGWPEVVLKPAVSGGAWRTGRARREDLPSQVGLVTDILSESSLLAQPFLPQIQAEGEVSLLFFDGRFSHAVVKRPKSGDYRVQWTHGGTQVAFTPSASLVAQGEAILRLAPEPGLYARVDGLVLDGRLVLMELEQLEPYLFFGESPDASDRFASALLARLSESSRV